MRVMGCVCEVQPARSQSISLIFYLILGNNSGIPAGTITYRQRKTPIIEAATSTGFKELTWIG